MTTAQTWVEARVLHSMLDVVTKHCDENWPEIERLNKSISNLFKENFKIGMHVGYSIGNTRTYAVWEEITKVRETVKELRTMLEIGQNGRVLIDSTLTTFLKKYMDERTYKIFIECLVKRHEYVKDFFDNYEPPPPYKPQLKTTQSTVQDEKPDNTGVKIVQIMIAIIVTTFCIALVHVIRG